MQQCSLPTARGLSSGKFQSASYVGSAQRFNAGTAHVARKLVVRAESTPSSRQQGFSVTAQQSDPFGFNTKANSQVTTQEEKAQADLAAAQDKFAKTENPWQPKRAKKIRFTDIVPWDEFKAVWDQDTCYQRLFRTCVTPLLYRKNIVVVDEQFQELCRVLIPILLEDGYIYGLDDVPREHKAWRIVDKWVKAVVEDDRLKRRQRESVKLAKINGHFPWERAIKLTVDTNFAIPSNQHRDFRDDYRLPAAIQALPDR